MGNATVILLILTELFWINLIQLKGKSAPGRPSVQEPKLAMKGKWFVTASESLAQAEQCLVPPAAATAPAKCRLCHHFARASRKQMSREG